MWPNADNVIRFYDTHPINARQILDGLAREGFGHGGLSQEALESYDQDHYGGLEAVDLLAARAGVDGASRVLDVCSGIGGPARYLAARYGCAVTGIDLTPSRHESAIRLTRMVGLDHRVRFRLGNALDMPFPDASFDVVISQEAFAQVPEKRRLIAECARVLEPGGRIAFTDILRGDHLEAATSRRLEREMALVSLCSLGDYRDLLMDAGFTPVSAEDLSVDWARILAERLDMYRSLRETTVARFGEAHFRSWDAAYAFFAGLFETGQLGGGRFIARR